MLFCFFEMKIKNLFHKFLESNSTGGILLLCCVVISLLIANTSFADVFQQLLDTHVGGNILGLHLRYSVLMWINDGLMAVFFLLVGLEIKREIVDGELSSFKKASLPILAAFGGVMFPALIFTAFAHSTEYASGWGIPVATDIAFALAVIMMLGKRVPVGLRVFLAALAIVDDLCAILIIALFYSSALNFVYLGFALFVFVSLLLMNRKGIKSLSVYIVGGIAMWYLIHHSGVHATIAGVLTAFAVPMRHGDENSPLIKLEHVLVRPVNLLIMPIFALANTNIMLDVRMLENITTPLGLGICCGLFFGKPIGILLFSWLSIRLKISYLPSGVRWRHILGAGVLAGIGFTMSIFIANLSFSDAFILGEAKLFILLTSIFAGICGFLFLKFYSASLRSH